MNEEIIYKACLNKEENNKSWSELAEEFNYGSPERLRGWFRREKVRRDSVLAEASVDKDFSDLDEEKYRASEEIKQDGSIVSDKLIRIREMDSKNPKSVLEAHGFDPEQWILINAKNNFWNGMRPKDRGLLVLFQSKITVKPRKESEITFSQVDDFFKNYQSTTKSDSSFTPRGYDKDGMVLEINLADLHVGNIGAYNVVEKDIFEKVDYVIEDILSRIKYVKISKIILVQNGDILHADTKGRTTTSMTHTVTTDGSTNYEMFDKGVGLLINAIDKLEKVAPVHVVGIYGNHDMILSYTLMKSLEFYYRENKNVTVDASHNPRKFMKFGNNLVLWAHGDISVKNVKSMIQKEARKEFGETKFAEIHLGNFHHQSVLEGDGIIIRYLPSISPTDEWHADKGYVGSIKTVQSFLWDLEIGLRETWFSNI